MLEGSRIFGARPVKNELNWVNKRASEIKKFVKSKAVPWKIIQNDSRFFEIATEWSYEEKIKHYNTLHNQYKQNVVKPSLNKLEVIVQFIQDIECMHFFADGNCRMIYLLLNKELMKHGFDPVILFNPNEFDYKTIKELIKEIEKGQQAFKYFIENGVPYASCVSDEQIAQNIENWENKKGVVGENDEVGDHVFFKKYIEFIETSQVAIAAMLEHHKKQVQVSVGQEQLLNQFVAMTNKVGQSLVMKEYYSIKNKLFKVGTFCTTEQKAVNDWMRKNWTTEVIPTLQKKENKIIDFLKYLDQTSTIGYLPEYMKGEGQTLKNKCDIIELTKFFSVYLDKLKLLCEKYINDYDIESLSNPLLCHLTISEQKALLPIEEVEIPNIESLHLDATDEVENLGDCPEITEI
ncbi:MAG: hypothetical protein EKK61_05545 [Rickettsiales bacterium]|nr:MAG: hypothetical protein EKK61_05545 [Rickettsiales bacterium]